MKLASVIFGDKIDECLERPLQQRGGPSAETSIISIISRRYLDDRIRIWSAHAMNLVYHDGCYESIEGVIDSTIKQSCIDALQKFDRTRQPCQPSSTAVYTLVCSALSDLTVFPANQTVDAIAAGSSTWRVLEDALFDAHSDIGPLQPGTVEVTGAVPT
jgi:hypothetical protein